MIISKGEIMKNTLLKSYLKYLIPTITTMILFSTYTMVDGIFVGRGVGASGISAVNVSMPYVTFAFSLSILISVGSLNLIGYQLGKGDKEKANEFFSICISMALVVAFLLASLSYIFIDRLIYFLGASPEIKPLVHDYISVIIFFTPFYIMSYAFEIMVKADGRPIVSTVCMAISAVTNIVLDYVFIFKLHMGVRGAAIATGIAQSLPTFAYLFYFLSNKAGLKFRKYELKLYKIKEVLSYGFPASVQELSSGFVILLFNNVISIYYGVEGLAAFSVISYIMIFVVNVMLAINQSSQPLLSFYFGKEEYENVLGIRKFMLRTVLIISILMVLVIELRPEFFVNVFIADYEESFLPFAIKSLRIFAISFLIMGFNITNAGYMTAVQRPRYDFYITILRGYVLMAVLVYLMPMAFGRKIIWNVATITEAITMVFSVFLVKSELKEIMKLTQRRDKHIKVKYQ